MYQLFVDTLHYDISMIDILRLELIVSGYLKPIYMKYQTPCTITDLSTLIDINLLFNSYLRKYITYHILITSTNLNDVFDPMLIQHTCERMRPWLIELLNFFKLSIEAYHAWQIGRISYIQKIKKVYQENKLLDRYLAGRLIRETQFQHYFNSISDYTVLDIPNTNKQHILLHMFLYKIKRDRSYSVIHIDFILQLFIKLFDSVYPHFNIFYSKHVKETEFQYY